MTNIITDLKKMFDSTRDQDILCSHTSSNLILHLSVLNDMDIQIQLNLHWGFMQFRTNTKNYFLTPGYIKLSLLGFLQFPNVSLFAVMLKIAGVQAVSSWIHSLRSSYSDDQYQTKNYDHHQVHRDDDCFESGALKKRRKLGNCPVNYTQKLVKHSLFFFHVKKIC